MSNPTELPDLNRIQPSHYSNGPGNVPRLPDRVVDTLIDSAGVSRCAPGRTDITVRDQTAEVEQLVHDVCEELLARLPDTRRAQPEGEAPQAEPAPEWGRVRTVADMVRNLLTLDQNDPIHSAFFVDFDGKRRCRTSHISISRERVIDGKWVDQTRKDVPYAIVVWAKSDERARQAAAPGASIDTPEFRELLAKVWNGVHPKFNSKNIAALVAHIDSRIAPSASGTPEAPADIVLDAQRWRAFLGSARIRPIGSAGIVRPEENHYAHLGLEIWTRYGTSLRPEQLEQLSVENARGRGWLTKYADIARAAQLDTAPEAPKGGA